MMTVLDIGAYVIPISIVVVHNFICFLVLRKKIKRVTPEFRHNVYRSSVVCIHLHTNPLTSDWLRIFAANRKSVDLCAMDA